MGHHRALSLGALALKEALHGANRVAGLLGPEVTRLCKVNPIYSSSGYGRSAGVCHPESAAWVFSLAK